MVIICFVSIQSGRGDFSDVIQLHSKSYGERSRAERLQKHVLFPIDWICMILVRTQHKQRVYCTAYVRQPTNQQIVSHFEAFEEILWRISTLMKPTEFIHSICFFIISYGRDRQFSSLLLYFLLKRKDWPWNRSR